MQDELISRQAVLDVIRKCHCDEWIRADIGASIEALSPVTPQAKTGHWIEKEGFYEDTYYDCSECGESFCLIDGTPTDNLYNHCPNCGAKMQEVKDE